MRNISNNIPATIIRQVIHILFLLPRPKLWLIPSGDTFVGLPPVSFILLPSEFLDSGVETGVVETDKCWD